MPYSESILIVEDESIVALDLKHQLLGLGYTVSGIAASGDEALRCLAEDPPQLILMDVRLQGGLDGIAVAAAVRRGHDIPVIFLTSHSDDETVRRAAETSPYGYLTKPYQLRELRAGIEVALTKARLERQLRQADRWFARTLQCVTDGVVVTDPKGRIRFINPAAESLTGWGHEDAAGHDIGEIVRTAAPPSPPGRTDAPAQRDATTALVRRVIERGRPTPVSYAVELTARDGATRVVDESVGPVKDDDGQPLGAVVILHDATERVAHEMLLRSSEERFRNAFEHAPLGMALVTLSGVILQANSALCRMLDTTVGALKQTSCAALGDEDDAEHEAQRLRELLSAGRGVVQFERRYRRQKDGGEPIWALASVSLLHTDGRPTCYLFQIHDLTAQKKAAEQLAELAAERMKRQASELAITAKSEFLSRVSHEMRTPLNAVIGFASLLELQVGGVGAKAGGYAHHIKAAGEHLLAMVNDLLDLNRTTNGELTLSLEPLQLAASVEQSLQMVQPLGQAHGIALDNAVDAGLVVVADRVRLQQVLLNVLSNAIKYNREGGFVRIRAAPAVPGRVRLRVEDAGIGMTPEQLQRLFNPFDRLGQERSQIPGAGLGLVISRGLVTQMGGTLDVESESRLGTTVTIELPAAAT